ncbi:YeaC family protein [Acinetobacter sp. S40]|uniref:YeaC family protein n=1 Tax=unclassified Acinetobacter TaxID=196816 RepID=UPI00190E04E6|nr:MULTISPECIES: YeaC family protein [unclassified Acinetobacter]MBJ9984837.1 YeaC family protein [Acinetobacter sp. S40]MBK0063172.1 YeaC family protein [Acinetobacter sp. S55]MBK0066410.1 YeaC family protein [Acinetobacter sp. S54]
MNIEQMLAVLDPDIVERLKTAVEIGKWPNGVVLTPEQRQICMQAVIAWEHQNVPEKQRTGYIDKGHKEGDECDTHEPQHDTEFKPIRFI